MAQTPSDPPPTDAELRRLLEDVAAGRVSVDQALPRIHLLRKDAVGQFAQRMQPLDERQKRAASWVVGVIFALIGTVFATIGIGFGWRSWDFEVGASRTPGTVIAMRRDGKNSRPVVKYSVQGKEYEVVGTMSSNMNLYTVGEQIAVLYKPDKPENAQINAFSERWLFPAIFGGIGVVLGCIGWGLLLFKLGALFLSRKPKPLAESERFTIE
jgi:hypothetical protein